MRGAAAGAARNAMNRRGEPRRVRGALPPLHALREARSPRPSASRSVSTAFRTRAVDGEGCFADRGLDRLLVEGLRSPNDGGVGRPRGGGDVDVELVHDIVRQPGRREPEPQEAGGGLDLELAVPRSEDRAVVVVAEPVGSVEGRVDIGGQLPVGIVIADQGDDGFAEAGGLARVGASP